MKPPRSVSVFRGPRPDRGLVQETGWLIGRVRQRKPSRSFWYTLDQTMFSIPSPNRNLSRNLYPAQSSIVKHLGCRKSQNPRPGSKQHTHPKQRNPVQAPRASCESRGVDWAAEILVHCYSLCGGWGKGRDGPSFGRQHVQLKEVVAAPAVIHPKGV